MRIGSYLRAAIVPALSIWLTFGLAAARHARADSPARGPLSSVADLRAVAVDHAQTWRLPP